MINEETVERPLDYWLFEDKHSNYSRLESSAKSWLLFFARSSSLSLQSPSPPPLPRRIRACNFHEICLARMCSFLARPCMCAIGRDGGQVIIVTVVTCGTSKRPGDSEQQKWKSHQITSGRRTMMRSGSGDLRKKRKNASFGLIVWAHAIVSVEKRGKKLSLP